MSSAAVLDVGLKLITPMSLQEQTEPCLDLEHFLMFCGTKATNISGIWCASRTATVRM